ncbi:MAG: hypothetical protein AAB623_01630 [Patescibacteria group bacterium]
MKKLFLTVVVVAILAFSISCRADEVSLVRINVVKKTAGFVAGFASGLGFHELGHEAMAKLEGAEMHWSDTNWSTNASPATLRNIAIAGFGAQILSTEVMLGTNIIPKDNSFVLGWLTFNILNTVQYVVTDNLRNGGYGDFETLRNNGGNTDLVKIGLLVHAVLSAYRLYKNPKFIPYVSATKDEFVLGLAWKWD